MSERKATENNQRRKSNTIFKKTTNMHNERTLFAVRCSHWASKCCVCVCFSGDSNWVHIWFCCCSIASLVLHLIKWFVAWCLTSWSFLVVGWSIAYARTYSFQLYVIIMRNRSNETNAHFIGWNDEQYGWMDMMKVSVRIIALFFRTKTAYMPIAHRASERTRERSAHKVTWLVFKLTRGVMYCTHQTQ